MVSAKNIKMSPPETIILTVSDIKQYFYCPRIVYYHYLMPGFRPVTYKMKEGKIRQKEEEGLEKRRTLSRFGLSAPSTAMSEPTRVFNIRLFSNPLGLSGLVDMALITDDEAIPVDFKDGSFSRGEVVSLHHKYQLIAYGLLLEDTYRKRSTRGFIHSLEDGNTKSIFFSDGAKMFLTGKIRKMQAMILHETFPNETPHKGRCQECEFRPVCKG